MIQNDTEPQPTPSRGLSVTTLTSVPKEPNTVSCNVVCNSRGLDSNRNYCAITRAQDSEIECANIGNALGVGFVQMTVNTNFCAGISGGRIFCSISSTCPQRIFVEGTQNFNMAPVCSCV